MMNIWIPESFRDRPFARKHFAETVQWAKAHHPFYREYISDLSAPIPLLTRAAAMQRNDALMNFQTANGYTSGSTGYPLAISWTAEKSRIENGMNNLFQKLMGGPLARVRLIGMMPGETQADAMLVGSPLAEQIDFILQSRRQRGIEAIVTYPTNAVNLAQFILREKLDLSFIKRVVCFSETLEDADREVIAGGFPNARIWTTYSSKEVGMIGFQCPHDQRFHHTNCTNLGIEVLNAEDQPCEMGEPGRVVLTDYRNRNSMFIRYDIDDVVVPGECPCGRFQGPAFRHVLGKRRGSLKNEQGEPVMFASIAARLRSVEGLLQYQVIQETLNSLRFRYVLSNEADAAAVRAACTSELEQFLGFSPDIRFEKETHIEKEPSGKFYATICRV